ncbi:ABC transporter substrate-binding protein [Jatrophihabitans sp. DSM 45814]
MVLPRHINSAAAPQPGGPDLWRGLVSRRTALVGLAGLVGVSVTPLLAACDPWPGKNAKSGSSAGQSDFSDSEPVVNWSNWPDYIDVDDDNSTEPSLDAFTKRTGITVNYTDDYNSNDEFFAEVQPQLAAGQDTGRDVWCSTDWLVARLIRRGWIQKLDRANIPNATRLQTSLQSIQFDPGRLYSLPWQSGFTGIGYNPKATAGKKIETIEQLLSMPELKGRVTLLSELQDTVGLVMLSLGIDPAKFTDADFDKAMDRLTKAKASGQIKGFTGNDYTNGLASGEIAACMAYTGDIVQLQADNPALGYTLPSTGHIIWSDNFVIPNHARHKKNAERLINYYYEPATMATVEDYVNYISPVQGSQEALLKSDPDVAKNPLIFPTAAVLARGHVFRGLTDDEEARYTKAFQQLIAD